MKRVHESVDYIKHRDRKQMVTLAEQLGNVDLRKDSLLDGVGDVRIAKYRVVRDGSNAKYVVYLVQVHSGGLTWELRRRYSEFRLLHDALMARTAPGDALPPLPPKRMFGGFSKDFLDRRQHDLEVYLRALAARPTLVLTPELREFLWTGHTMVGGGVEGMTSSSSSSSAAAAAAAASASAAASAELAAERRGAGPMRLSPTVGSPSVRVGGRPSVASSDAGGAASGVQPLSVNSRTSESAGQLSHMHLEEVGKILDFDPHDALSDEESDEDGCDGSSSSQGEGDMRLDAPSAGGATTTPGQQQRQQQQQQHEEEKYGQPKKLNVKTKPPLFVDTAYDGADHDPAPLTGQTTTSTTTSRVSRSSQESAMEDATVAPPTPAKKPSLDDFEMVRVLGKGSFGKVLLCKKKDTGHLFAIKVLKKRHVVKRKQVAHTKTERSVLGIVDHPFVVKLHYAFQTGDKLHFVLDFCSGGELFFHLGRAGRFSENLGRFYAAEIALALGHLHTKGVVYRDLKPENILLDDEGHIKLADFGLSKEGIMSGIKGTHSFCGTPEYLAPEVLNRRGHGTSVDWWSLGALLYEMLTGLPPWYSQDRQKMFACIRSSELRFPEYVSSLAQLILTDFLERDVTKRLGSVRGVDDVKEHPFFQYLDWDKLYRREIPSPFVPRLKSKTDTANFDSQFTRLPINSIDASSFVGSPRTGPPVSSSLLSEGQHFDGFTFAEPSTLATHMAAAGSSGLGMGGAVGAASDRMAPHAPAHSPRMSAMLPPSPAGAPGGLSSSLMFE